MLRSIGAVIAGYLVTSLFVAAFSSVVGSLFSPERGSMVWATLEIVIRLLAAITGGYVAARIAVVKELLHAVVLGALLTILNVILRPFDTSVLFQIINAMIFLPGAWLGGYLRLARHRAEDESPMPGASI